jgi:shikimate kinase
VSDHRRHLVLVGLMGSGKSTVARLVARRTGRRVVDVDAEVERAAGCTIATLFATRGEPVFRRHETDALREALEAHDPCVIATGGGVVTQEINRSLLLDHPDVVVVWLDATPEQLLARVTTSTTVRPLLANDPLGVLRRLHEERRPWYAEVADHRVDAGGSTPDAVVEAIMHTVAEPGAHPS